MELKELLNKLANLFKSDDFVQSLEQTGAEVSETAQVESEQTHTEEVVATEQPTETTPTESDDTGKPQSTPQSTSPTELAEGWLKKDGEQVELQNIDLSKVNNAELRQVLEAAQSIAAEYNNLNSKYSKQAEQLQKHKANCY